MTSVFRKIEERRDAEKMAIVSIGDLLDRASSSENKLERYYASIRDCSRDNGVRLLTYYLARHRKHIQEALDNFSSQEVERIRKIQLKYDIDFNPEREFHLMKTPPEEVEARELLEAAVAYDQQLVDLYKKILEQPMSDEARSVVEALIRIEERDIVMLKKMIAMDYF